MAQNLWFPSENVAGWTNTNVTPSTGILAPDGSSNGGVLTESTDGAPTIHLGTPPAAQQRTRTVGALYTESVHLRVPVSNYCRYVFVGVNGGGSGLVVDLLTGTIKSVSDGTGNLRGYGVLPVKNGWWRVFQTYKYVTSYSFAVYFMDAAGTTTNYQGTGRIVNAWGAQCTEGAALTEYIPSVGAYIDTGAMPGLIVPQNLMRQSNMVGVYPPWNGVGMAAVVTGRADPLGGTTARRITDDGTNGAHAYVCSPDGGINGKVNTWTIRLQYEGSQDLILLGGNGGDSTAFAYFSLANGTVTNVGANVRSSSIRALGNNWYECYLTWLGNANASGSTLYLASAVGTVSYQGTGKYLTVWRSQIEQSNTTGPYVETLLTKFDAGAPRIL